MPNAETNRGSRRILALIMVAVAAWGVWLAVGAYLYKRNPWPPIVVLACFAVFLGSWLLLLRRRAQASGNRSGGRR